MAGTKPHPVEFKEGITKDEKYWASGLIDSVGSYFLYRAQKSHKYALRVRIENDKDDRDALFEMFGGYRSDQEYQGRKFYWLNFQQYRCYCVLKELLPMLKGTRREAEIILEAVEHIWVHRRVRGELKEKSIAKVDGWMSELKEIHKSKSKAKNE